MGTARKRLAGCGTQTAALAFGGLVPPSTTATEEYNGSSWTAGGALTTARRDFAGAGTQTAGLAFSGAPRTGPEGTAVEEYDVRLGLVMEPYQQELKVWEALELKPQV